MRLQSDAAVKRMKREALARRTGAASMQTKARHWSEAAGGLDYLVGSSGSKQGQIVSRLQGFSCRCICSTVRSRGTFLQFIRFEVQTSGIADSQHDLVDTLGCLGDVELYEVYYHGGTSVMLRPCCAPSWIPTLQFSLLPPFVFGGGGSPVVLFACLKLDRVAIYLGRDVLDVNSARAINRLQPQPCCTAGLQQQLRHAYLEYPRPNASTFAARISSQFFACFIEGLFNTKLNAPASPRWCRLSRIIICRCSIEI